MTNTQIDEKDRILERELGTTEIVSHLLHKQDPPFSTYLHAAIIHTEREVTETCLTTVLNSLIKSQPFLHSKLSEEVDKDGVKQYYFRQIDGDFPVPVSVRNVGKKEDWIKEGERMLLQHFSTSTGPLWEVSLLKVNDNEKKENKEYCFVLIFLMHHVFVDAKGMCDFVQNQFLPLLAKILNEDEVREETLDSLLPRHSLPPCAEVSCLGGALSGNVSWYVKLAMKAAQIYCNWRNMERKPPSLAVCDEEMILSAGATLGPRLYTHTIDIDKVDRLRAASKAHGVALTSVLSTALTLSMEKVLHDRNRPSAGPTYSIHIPVDLRRFNPTLCTSPMPLGCYVGGFMPKLKPQPEKHVGGHQVFWELSKKMQRQIDGDMNKLKSQSGPNKMSQLMKYIVEIHSDEKPVWGELSQMAMRFHFGLSNAGVCESKMSIDASVLEVEAQYFAASVVANSKSEPLFICIITTRTGMHFLSAYHPLWIDKSFLCDVFQHLNQLLFSTGIIGE